MPPLEEYLKNADRLAQEVVNAWGINVQTDNAVSAEFKALVDKTIGGVMKSGEIDKIYAKWFTSPIPPKGVNLNFPQTPAIKAAFANPNDKGVE